MEKMTLAKRNELLREKGIANFSQARPINKNSSQLGLNVELDGEYYFVRFDVVVPKDCEDFLLEDYLEELEIKKQEDEIKANEKAKAKEEKIARDKARKEKKESKGE